MKENAEAFVELAIPRREMVDLSETRYRVYTDARNYEIVTAASALDALRASGIKKAYKIERHNPMADNILHLVDQDMAAPALEAVDAPLAQTPAPQPQAEAAPVAEAAPAAEPAAALSNDDVDKLLNG